MADRERPDQDRPDHDALARQYREAAEDDAWHKRAGGGPAHAGLSHGGRDPTLHDPTLVPTPELPHKPLTDVAHPDPTDSENHLAPPSPLGPYHDKLMRGLEPGEGPVE